MAASKQNFFKAHWDMLVLGCGLAALGAAAFLLVQSMAQSPEEAKSEFENELQAEIKKPKATVESCDLSEFDAVMGLASKPPRLPTIDSKKGSFLASEGRLFCQNAKCGKPIPSMSEECPICHEKQNVVKIEADADHDGLPNDWEKKYGLNPEDAADAALDSDGDGFTNLEEFKAKTNPKDKFDHPDYLEFLAVSGRIQDTTLDFYFKDAQQIRDGYRFTFQRLEVKNKNAKKTYTAVLNGEITTGESEAKFRVNSGWKAVAFEKKTIDKKIAGSQQTVKVDASEVVIERLDDGKKITLVIVPDPKRYADRIKTALESRIDLVWNRGEGKTIKGLSEGSTFELNERKYKVAKLKKADGGPEVTVIDLKTKKEKIIR